MALDIRHYQKLKKFLTNLRQKLSIQLSSFVRLYNFSNKQSLINSGPATGFCARLRYVKVLDSDRTTDRQLQRVLLHPHSQLPTGSTVLYYTYQGPRGSAYTDASGLNPVIESLSSKMLRLRMTLSLLNREYYIMIILVNQAAV